MTVSSLLGATLTGTLNNPDGTGGNGYLIFALAQQAALMSTSGCGGPIQVVPQYQVQIKVVNGAMVSPPSIYGNDCLLPQGTYYNITFKDNNGNLLLTDRWIITGSSVDIGTIQSVVLSGTTGSLGGPGVIFTVPSGAQQITQPSTSVLSINNFTVTGIFNAPGGGQCTSSGCTGFLTGNAVTLTGAQTITGQKTLNASLLANGTIDVGSTTQPFTVGRFNGAVESHVVEILTNGTTFASPVTYQWLSSSTTSMQFNDPSGTAILTYLNVGGAAEYIFSGDVVPNGSSYNLGSTGVPWVNAHITNLMTTGNSSITIGSTGNFYGRTFTGADAACGSVADGWTGLRADTHELQVCLGGTLYKIALM
jgi:hypothetical protein